MKAEKMLGRLYMCAESLSEGVVEAVAQNGSKGNADEQGPNIERTEARERTGSEEEGVAGEEWSYDQTCFKENDNK